MDSHQNDQSFQYTYSAKEQEELKRIRSKYMPKEENKMELVRRLDNRATDRATISALAVGFLGTMILGTGMSFCMVWTERLFIPGILLGLFGFAVLGTAYPLYVRTLRKERARIAPQILRLTEELMK